MSEISDQQPREQLAAKTAAKPNVQEPPPCLFTAAGLVKALNLYDQTHVDSTSGETIHALQLQTRISKLLEVYDGLTEGGGDSRPISGVFSQREF